MLNKISHSAIKDYQACPLLFFYRHMLNLQDPFPSIHLTFGKSLHLGLEMKVKKNADSVEVFKQSFTSDKLSKEDKLKFLELSEKGRILLREFVKQNMCGLDIVKTEEKIVFKEVIEPITKTPLLFGQLTGIIDFETADGAIGDYKTSSHRYKQEEVDTSLQPTIYYLLYYLKYKRLPTKFIYVVFLKKRKRDMIQIIETKRDFDDFPKLVNLCNEIYKKVEAKQFERMHQDFQRCDCYKFDELLRV